MPALKSKRSVWNIWAPALAADEALGPIPERNDPCRFRRYAPSLDEFIAALRTAMVNAAIDPLGSSAQAEWLCWLSAYRECVDPFEELFEEIEKPTPDWYWKR